MTPPQLLVSGIAAGTAATAGVLRRRDLVRAFDVLSGNTPSTTDWAYAWSRAEMLEMPFWVGLFGCAAVLVSAGSDLRAAQNDHLVGWLVTLAGPGLFVAVSLPRVRLLRRRRKE